MVTWTRVISMNMQKGRYIKIRDLCYNQKELLISMVIEGVGEVVGWLVMQE